MDSERWQDVAALYHGALERDPASRAAFLDGACGNDVDLRREIESLLAESPTGEGSLDGPISALLAEARTIELISGTRLGPYQIEGLIGQGGMGKVYRARDTRLGRTVAIKISSARFSERFEREARAVAALNHPHICHLYDVGPDYLVMEYIEGTPLKGPLPGDQALKYAEQILDALDAAHRKGITHRDLKPGNILVSKQGIKLLDFGLAQMEPGPEDPTLAPSGPLMGSPAYMAPERWEGKRADARSDIYSFGCVLYEMLTGKRVAADRAPVPARLEDILRTCLEKDPDERWQSTRELKHALRWAAEAKPETADPIQARKGWIAAVIAPTLLLGALAFIHFREKPADAPAARFSIVPPEKTSFNDQPPALSPDGRRLVFAAQSADGSQRLWVRALNSVTAQPLPGTEGASLPFWSPDSRFIGFGAGGSLKVSDLSGGPVVTLADAPRFLGATWSRQGVIVFAPNSTGPLQRVPAGGGTATPATALDRAHKETSHQFPWFLPDGRHFLFTAWDNGDDTNIRVGSLDSRESRVVAHAASNAVYASGYLLFQRDDTLMAQPFDAKRFGTTGEAVPVAENILNSAYHGELYSFGVSDHGMLVFQPGAQTEQSLAWVDRTGKRLAVVGEPGDLYQAFLSPDGKRATVSVADRVAHQYDLWVYDLARNLRSRFTFDSGDKYEGIWSPDGSRIIFYSNRKGHSDLYRKRADGAGAEEPLFTDDVYKFPVSWSPDGKFLMYFVTDPKTRFDLWVLPLEGDRKAFPFLKTGFNEVQGQFSPDGQWVAYKSDESGRYEIYVVPFPGPGGKRQVSLAGGTQPRWRADGKELFYIAPDRRLMTAEIGMKGADVEIGVVRPLFGPLETGQGYHYDVSPDGQRFLAILPSEPATPEPLTLVQNWTAGLKK